MPNPWRRKVLSRGRLVLGTALDYMEAKRTLNRLTDHLLMDVGIARADIEDVVTQALKWRWRSWSGDSQITTNEEASLMGGTCFTRGIDHVGLTVRDLAATRDFFIECMGWRLLGENASYPAAFVSDGSTRVTLWRAKNLLDVVTFDRHRNIGLHHLALKVMSAKDLHAAFAPISNWPGVTIEFAPELSGKGPKMHAMFREPSGNRIELSWDPR